MPVEIASPARLKWFFWLSMALIAVVSLISFYSTNRLIALSARAERTQAILGELNRFLSDLERVETGARGYVITGDARFLAAQKAGPNEAERTLRRLQVLGSGDARLGRRLDRMRAFNRRRTELAEALVARRAERAGAAALIPALQASKANMDQARREVGATFAAEAATQRTYQRAVERQAVFANFAMALAVAVSLALIVRLFAIQRREIARRRRAEDELKTLNAELEDRVEARSADVARSRELLDAVIENMPDPVILKDASAGFRYVLVNAAAQKLMGMAHAELIGHVDHEIFPEDQAAISRSTPNSAMGRRSSSICRAPARRGPRRRRPRRAARRRRRPAMKRSWSSRTTQRSAARCCASSGTSAMPRSRRRTAKPRSPSCAAAANSICC